MREEKNSGDKESDPLLLLGGTGLRVYLFLLRKGGFVGVRELQRSLGFRSPSTARHHLERLVDLGLARKTSQGYIAVKPKGLLSMYITISGFFLPRMVFIAVFSIVATVIYSILPGSDVAAIIVMSFISILLLFESLRLHRSLKRIVNTKS